MLSIIFIGTSSFAIPTLLALRNDARFKILAVITQPAKPVGRKLVVTPSPVEEKAVALGLKIWSPEKISDVADKLAALSPDGLVVASYGQIIPKIILDLPRLGAFNLHPSLLPKYRGASPVPAAILAGETETGVTIMLMDDQMDHGPILAQEKIKISEDLTAPDLLKELSELGASLLPQTIIDFNDGKIKAQPQNHQAATYSKILTREDGQINFKKTAAEIYNHYRALIPWPGIFAHTADKKILKLLKVARADYLSHNAPGTLFQNDGKLFLQATDGALKILELQLAGGQPLTATNFLNGYAKKLPLILK